MCGLFGYDNLKGAGSYDSLFFDALKHRGPDCRQSRQVDRWILGHLRLSILDVSDAANQPFNIGGDWLIFNGEIYNYLELRKELLSDLTLKTTSDTEVLLQLLRRHGVSVLNRLNGMFAFAWYNQERGELVLVRDRFGVKPMYWMMEQGRFFFASEMRPLIKIKPGFLFNQNVVDIFLNDLAADFGDRTFAHGINQLSSGHYLVVKDGRPAEPQAWYHWSDYKFDPALLKDYKTAVGHYEDLLVDAISLRHRSDVPLAITLSGGLDSTTIYTLAKERVNSRIKPFTFLHPGAATDESEKAARLAADYGDQLLTVRGESHDQWADLEEALYYLEFPIWSPSAIAYLDMYKAIKQQGFKVVIEGHGSDEQLGGYPYMVEAAWLQALATGHWPLAHEIFRVGQSTLNSDLGQQGGSPGLRSDWQRMLRLALSALKRQILHPSVNQFSLQSVLDDSFRVRILPLVLRTFDRLSMSQSIESRSPFMDYRLVEFGRALPFDCKVNEIGSKAVLREILKKYGKDFIYKDRQKMGFAADLPRFFNQPDNRASFKDYVNRFPAGRLSGLKAKALRDLEKEKIGWLDTDAIWKLASIMMTKEMYENN